MLSSFTRRPTRTVVPAAPKPTQFVDAALKHLPGAKPDLRGMRPHEIVEATAHLISDDGMPEILRRDYVYERDDVPETPHGSRPAMPRQLGGRK